MLNNDIIKKIDSAFEMHFLGESLELTEEEKSIIYDEVGSLLRKIGSERGKNIEKNEYKMVVIAIVELTKKWDSDEEAWRDFIFKKLFGSQSDCQGKIYNQIRKCIDSLYEDGKMFLFHCFTKKYYTSICSHAFAPQSSVFSFFDMCWEIYCKDLNQQYAPNDPILKIIASSLKSKFSDYESDDKDISIGSKVYALRAGIKGLAIEQEELLISLLNSSLLGIHSLMNNEPISVNTYSKKLLKEWWNNKEASFGIKRERSTSSREFVATDYSQIKAKYMRNNGKALLVISPFRLVDNFDCEPNIQVFVNGNVVKDEPIPTRGSGVIMTTNAIEYELNSFSLNGNDEIEIKITHANKIIFKSENTLKRDFIIFSCDREVGSQTLLPGNYFIYTPKIEEMTYPKDIHAVEKNLYNFTATDGEVVRSANRIIFFETEKTKKDIYLTSSEKQGTFYRENGFIYKIIDGDIYVNVSLDYDISDLGVRYIEEDVHFKLSEFNYVEEKGYKKFKISFLADAGKPFRVSVFKYSDNYIVDALNVIKFDNISIEFDKALYYGNDCFGKVFFKTERYNLEEIFDASADENTIKFGNGEIVFIPPVLKWRFDEDDWNIKPSEPFYFKHLTNSSLLDIQMPLQVDYQAGILPTNNPVESVAGKQLFKVGQTIHSLSNANIDDVTIFVRSRDVFYEIAQVFLKQKFIVKEPLYVNSEEYKIEWNPHSFIGDENSVLKLLIINYKNEVIDERFLNMKESETINVSFLNEDYYTLKVVMPSRGFLIKETELFNKKYLFGNIKNIRFRGKILKINEAMIFDNSSPQNMKPIYFSDLTYLGTKDGGDIYSAHLYFIDKEGNRDYIDYMCGNKNESVRINPVRIELKTLSSCYLGYGLDVDDPEFEYDGEFILTKDGKTKIGDRTSDSRDVDFYMFKECKE